MSRAVWITGIGTVSAAGPDAPALRDVLRQGRACLSPAPDLGGLVVGAVAALPWTAAARRLDRAGSMFVAAAEEAWVSARLPDRAPDPRRAAVVEGSSLGPIGSLLAAVRVPGPPPGPRPSDLVRFMPGAGGVAFARHRGVEGPVSLVSAGSVSSAYAIGQAAAEIGGGRIDLAVVGGAEAPLQADIVERFIAAGILSLNGDRRLPCRPFSADRRGTVLGEGAGVLVLEAEERARARGAPFLAIVRGFGAASETHSTTAPHPGGVGLVEAIRQAMGSLEPSSIAFVKAHATGTVMNDAAEAAALAAVFGDRLAELAVTGLKPTLGHCLGASGALETAAAVLALGDGIVPPLLGTSELDPQLPPLRLATRPGVTSGRTAILLHVSFGGRCAVLRIDRA